MKQRFEVLHPIRYGTKVDQKERYMESLEHKPGEVIELDSNDPLTRTTAVRRIDEPKAFSSTKLKE